MTVTKQKVIDHEAKLKQLKREVKSLQKQLQHAQRLASVGTMTAMIAHEFNNILTPIISYAQLAQKNPQLTEKAITRAADGGQRATQICQAILEITRGNASAPQEVSVGSLISETLAAMARDPQKDGIELCVDVDPALKITTRKIELQQVLLNLLLNARNALMENGRGGIRKIHLAALKKDDSLIFTIQDTGVGIKKEHRKLIFEPFFTTRDGVQGHGLGLALCSDIIKSMQGSISVESTPGEGTVFTVAVPA